MRTTVMSQLCLHTLMQTQLSANQSASSYFIIIILTGQNVMVAHI